MNTSQATVCEPPACRTSGAQAGWSASSGAPLWSAGSKPADGGGTSSTSCLRTHHLAFILKLLKEKKNYLQVLGSFCFLKSREQRTSSSAVCVFPPHHLHLSADPALLATSIFSDGGYRKPDQTQPCWRSREEVWSSSVSAGAWRHGRSSAALLPWSNQQEGWWRSAGTEEQGWSLFDPGQRDHPGSHVSVCLVSIPSSVLQDS